MKRLLIGSIIVVLGLLVAGFATPIFAHGPDGDGTTSSDDEVWEAMHEACESGDWEAMAEAAEEVDGDSFGYMPCHDEDDHADHWQGGMGGHMGGGMMGWY